MATQRTAALNLLRLAGFQSIRAELQAVMHDITALLAMARRRPESKPCCNYESTLQSLLRPPGGWIKPSGQPP